MPLLKRNLMLLPIAIITLGHLVAAPPAPTKTTTLAPASETEVAPDQNFGLHYDEYLQAVIKLLERDEEFRNTLENAEFEDIKSGKLSGAVQKIPGEIREKLDALKREELSRLRRILRVKMDAEKGIKPRQTEHLRSIAQHLDSNNPHTFESEDLTNLIKAATEDLENYDKKRHQDFKKYEMMKDMRRAEKLKQMSSDEKKAAEEEYRQMREKHIDHPKVNHPGGKIQLDEVWKNKDGLVDEAFDPRTFFIMHDVNGDNSLDPTELEALFDQELNKVYDVKNPEDDMVEREEEQRRMREHVTNEVDKDGDGLVSLEEFLAYTKTEGFEHPDDESYKSVDELIEENDIYTAEELDEFREMIKEHESDLQEKLDNIQKKSATIAEMKVDVAEHEQRLGPNPPEQEVDDLEIKKQQIEDEEKELDELKEDAEEHREEISDMKDELKEQEEAIKGQDMKIELHESDGENEQEPQDIGKDRNDPALQMEKKSE